MSKSLTLWRQVCVLAIALTTTSSALAENSILFGNAEQKKTVTALVQKKFGNDIRDLKFTVFSYDQIGWEVFANALPGVAAHGVSFKLKNGTPLHCAWADSAQGRVIELRRCEIVLNLKSNY